MAKKKTKTHKTHVITEEMYKSAIEASTGTVTDLSQRLNVTHGAVSHYLETHQKLRQLLSDKRMSNVELAEDVLFDHLKKGTDQKVRQDSAKFIATRLGKNRGWTEKTETEITGTMNNNIDLSLISLCEEYNKNEK